MKKASFLGVLLISLLNVACGGGNHIDGKCELSVDSRFSPVQVEDLINAVDLWIEATGGGFNVELLFDGTTSPRGHVIRAIGYDNSDYKFLSETCEPTCPPIVFANTQTKDVWGNDYYRRIDIFVNTVEIHAGPSGPVWQTLFAHELGHHWALHHEDESPLMSSMASLEVTDTCISKIDLDNFCAEHECHEPHELCASDMKNEK